MTDRPDEKHRSPSVGGARDSQDGPSHSRLTSMFPSTGGGLVKPSSSTTEQKKGGVSVLGLDRLAAEKRQTQQRQYRRSQDETPSHPGGVSREAQDRVKDRERRQRQQRYHPYADSRRRDDRGDERDWGQRDYRGRGNEGDRDNGRREDSHRGRDDSFRRGDDSRRRGNDSYRSENRWPSSSMPPPPSHVTPSTQASRPSDYRGESSSRSFSSARSSRWRPRGEDSSVDAPTPLRNSSGRYPSPRTPSRRRNDASSSWDIETPLPDREDVDSKLRPPSDDSEFERQFYLAEDEGHFVMDQSEMAATGDMGRFLFNNQKTKAREAEIEKKRQEHPLSGRFSARKSALQDDQHAWEENRLLSSGAAVKGKEQ